MFDHRMYDGSSPAFTKGLLDFPDMPICDGVEAARRIRAVEAERGYDPLLPSEHILAMFLGYSYSRVPFQVIALSADCQESTKQLCLNAGMDAFLSKPANKTQLFNLLRRLVPSPPMDADAPAVM